MNHILNVPCQYREQASLSLLMMVHHAVRGLQAPLALDVVLIFSHYATTPHRFSHSGQV